MVATQNLGDINRLVAQGDLDAAEQQLKAASAGNRNNSAWWLLKGRVASRQGRHEDASDCLEKSVELDPDNIEALFQLAYAADLHGDDQRAVELYQDCAGESPAHVNTLINLAVIYEDLERYDEAEDCLQRVLDHDPNHKRAAMYLKDVISSQSMYYDEDSERNREMHDAVLDIPIADFELSVRSRNCLKKMDINTLGDLLNTTEPQLLSYKNFGETSLNEIKAMLRQKGLHLGQALEEQQLQRTSVAALAPPLGDPTVLNKPVSELELSVRSRKCLQRLGIATLGDLAAKSEQELLNSKNFGQTSLQEVKQRLAESGLTLRKSESKLL